MEKWKSNKMSIVLVSCMLFMLLIFSMLLEFTFSWLFASVTKQSATANLGKVDSAITSTTNTETKDVRVTMPAEGSTIALSEYTKIKNNGNTPALLRVFYSITIDEDKKQIATTNDFSSLTIHDNFLASDENIPNTFSGYYYYNAPLAPGAEVSLLNSAKPTSTIAGKQVKINMMAELVNYIGGPYEIGTMLPWNNTPFSWFVNVVGLYAPSTTTLSPKLSIDINQLDKIEITAKVDSIEEDGAKIHFVTGDRYNSNINKYLEEFDIQILYESYSGGYYFTGGGIDWDIPSEDPNEIVDGNFHTFAFSNIGPGYVQQVDYIYFPSNTIKNDSKVVSDITYKQIRIWNKSDELIYDLRADVSGKFLNAVTGELMPMYDFSSGTPVATTEVYDYMGYEVASADFETNDGGFYSKVGDVTMCTLTRVTNEKYSGVCSLKITGNGMDNIPNIANDWPPGARRGSLFLEKGYKYKFSCWYKSDAPAGSMNYAYYNSGTMLKATPPGMVIEYPNTKIYASLEPALYSYSGDWELLVIETPVVDKDTWAVVNLSCLTDASINTYIDDFKIVRMPN